MEDPSIMNPGISNSSPFPLEHQSGTAPSNTTKTVKPCTKKGIGSQHCGMCQMLGHNSKSLFPLSCRYLILGEESNSQCPMKLSKNVPCDLIRDVTVHFFL